MTEYYHDIIEYGGRIVRKSANCPYLTEKARANSIILSATSTAFSTLQKIQVKNTLKGDFRIALRTSRFVGGKSDHRSQALSGTYGAWRFERYCIVSGGSTQFAVDSIDWDVEIFRMWPTHWFPSLPTRNGRNSSLHLYISRWSRVSRKLKADVPKEEPKTFTKWERACAPVDSVNNYYKSVS